MSLVSWQIGVSLPLINSDGEEDGDGQDNDVVEYDCGDDDDQITMAACE